jgi:membrane fusion protein, type I secretion system
MLIFPDADSLTVEAKVNPQHIEQVQLRQKALLRFRHSTRPRLRRSMERFLDLR